MTLRRSRKKPHRQAKMILTNCAACAAPLPHKAKQCSRCKTRYCGPACQKEHWDAAGGHKDICKKIKKGGGAEQYHADKKTKEAVAVAAEVCADDTKGQTCYICTQTFHWKTKDGLVRMCACRGTAGFAHVSCLAEQAKILIAEAWENHKDSQWPRWHTCSLCEQDYHGVVKCALGWACWKTYVGWPETKWARSLAMSVLGNGLAAANHHEDALSVGVAELAMMRRIGAPEDVILDTQGNLATTYEELGRSEEALSMRRDVYSGTLNLCGIEHESTLSAASNYAVSLKERECFDEAKSLLRKGIPVTRRVLGDNHEFTIKMRATYAQTLYKADGATLDDLREAVTTLEELERTARRVFGGAYPTTSSLVKSLEDARAALIAREAEATEAAAQNAFRTARVELARERSELAEALAVMRVAGDEG